MTSGTENVSVLKLTQKGAQSISDVVAREIPLTIILNNKELVTLLCTPENLDYLAVGFLSSEGFLKSSEEIKKIRVDAERGVVRVETFEDKPIDENLIFKRLITSGCGRGASFYSAQDAVDQEKVESDLKISAAAAIGLVREFQRRSELYRSTGGVHSAALCETEKVLVFAEDIGRHNAVDKIFGECLMKGIPTADRLVVTSGRISSEILLKVARRNIPIIISKSAPTDLGVRIAGELGITLLGFARGGRVNVYTNEWRIAGNAGQ